jgi:hypothetical protein|tara:strand:+ start:716 stop:1093 length:378 start_codon:yes stop_codon:yes gene_type:complete
MVGNHKSGRKPSAESSYTRTKKVSFYVKEYAVTNHDGNIVEWVEDPMFLWFKRHHGAQWQARVRAWMHNDIESWKKYHHWRCGCPNRGPLGNYHHNRTPQCQVCKQWKNKAMEIQNDKYRRLGSK